MYMVILYTVLSLMVTTTSESLSVLSFKMDCNIYANGKLVLNFAFFAIAKKIAKINPSEVKYSYSKFKSQKKNLK